MNQVFTHPGQPQMQAEVILASSTAMVPTLYTVRLRYPRIIHAEFMTHRVFSRNARSSRAVPIEKMIREIEESPFVPWHWGKNQKGMQAGEECHALVGQVSRVEAWLFARDDAVYRAKKFAAAGYHKQIVNRLLEPFMWIDVLVSATDWENFLWLRDHKDAEPHLQYLARLVDQALKDAPLQQLEPGQWHQPYITEDDEYYACQEFGNPTLGFKTEVEKEFLNRISSARCARISYAPFDGDPSYERELERFEKLISSDRIHASPMEHQAKPDGFSAYVGEQGFFRNEHLRGNFDPGWIQFRKTIPGEHVRDRELGTCS